MKTNRGSRTPRVGDKTINDLRRWSDTDLIRKLMWKRSNSNKYTLQGRQEIHQNLFDINVKILRYLMRNSILNWSIDYNDDRIFHYSRQMVKCAVTGKRMIVEEIHCHHKLSVMFGGDSHAHLTLVCAEVHGLIRATLKETITTWLKAS